MRIFGMASDSRGQLPVSAQLQSSRNLPIRCRKPGFILGTAALASLIACSGPKENVAPMTTQAAVPAPLIDEMVAMINTEVDPAYLYEYQQTKFVPPPGKTLLIMGQTLEDIKTYSGRFADQPVPAGWSAYWGIPGIDGVMENSSGEHGAVQNHQHLVDRYPDTVLHSALWMVGMWDVLKNTVDGEYDPVIKEYSRWAKTVDRPIYLRIGYEFDGAHNQMEPDEYVKAYRRIVDIMRAEGVTNVAYIWHSYAAPTYKGYPLADWYPGDEYVDWVGISLFGHMYAAELNAEGDAVFKFARDHSKPVIVSEASPIHGIERGEIDVWNSWFVNFLSLSYRRNVKAIAFINANWEAVSITGISEWKDARLQNNSEVHRAWFRETAKDRYLKQSPELFELLGYPQ